MPSPACARGRGVTGRLDAPPRQDFDEPRQALAAALQRRDAGGHRLLHGLRAFDDRHGDRAHRFQRRDPLRLNAAPDRDARDAGRAGAEVPEGDRRAKEREGIAAWKAWAEKHHAAIVSMGGPLGKTKKVTQRGIDDTSNDMGAFTVVRADSHEAAAKLFERHPHFSIFPGDSVEIMPVLPIPGA